MATNRATVMYTSPAMADQAPRGLLPITRRLDLMPRQAFVGAFERCSPSRYEERIKKKKRGREGPVAQ